jgi:hypothetical protein
MLNVSTQQQTLTSLGRKLLVIKLNGVSYINLKENGLSNRLMKVTLLTKVHVHMATQNGNDVLGECNWGAKAQYECDWCIDDGLLVTSGLIFFQRRFRCFFCLANTKIVAKISARTA